MADYLFIVPGYSDEDFSFLPLRNLLVNQNLYKLNKIKSIEYASLDDQVDFPDFADKLDWEYEQFLKDHDGSNVRIDILAHSTGSLVVRSWLYLRRKRQQAKGQKLDVPVEHLFLFAPANFGSDLACIGRSSLNAARVTLMRIKDKWQAKDESERMTLDGNRDLFETGRKVLQGLEPASPIQWNLSVGDLHCETYFGPNDQSGQCCYPFVFSAGKPKDINAINWEKIHFMKPLFKDGTDNTIRIAGTSLNTRMVTLRSQKGQSNIEWDSELITQGNKLTGPRKFQDIPFAIYQDYDHCGIINGNNDKRFKKPRTAEGRREWDESLPAKEWLPLDHLKDALRVKTEEEYQKVAKVFEEITDDYIDSRQAPKKGVFQQFFFKAIDDTGQDVIDFDIDFEVREKNTNKQAVKETGKLHEIMNKTYEIHDHSIDGSNKVLMLGNITEIEASLCKLDSNKEVIMIVTAQGPYNGVAYEKAQFIIYNPHSSGFGDNSPSFFHPFTTTLVKIVFDRVVHHAILSRGDFTIGS